MSVMWIGFDRWRADEIVKRYPDCAVIPAEMDGRGAYAVTTDLEVERIEWDNSASRKLTVYRKGDTAH